MTALCFQPRDGRTSIGIAAAILLASLFTALAPAAPAGAEPAAQPRILVHLVPRTTKVGTCATSLADCNNATTYGFASSSIEIFYNAFLIVTGYDTAAGLHEVSFAIDYEKATGSGVDIFDWNLCGAVSLGNPNWYVTGAGNQIRWDDCPKTPLAVAGYFYITAYSGGKLGVVPPPGVGAATVQSCGGQPIELPLTSLGFAGFGDQSGCTPCAGPCEYVAVRPTTWSSIKAGYGTAPP